MYSVEWQKRGLPHTHFHLVNYKIHPEKSYSIISSKIPDPYSEQLLLNTAIILGPCGNQNRLSPCMGRQ